MTKVFNVTGESVYGEPTPTLDPHGDPFHEYIVPRAFEQELPHQKSVVEPTTRCSNGGFVPALLINDNGERVGRGYLTLWAAQYGTEEAAIDHAKRVADHVNLATFRTLQRLGFREESGLPGRYL